MVMKNYDVLIIGAGPAGIFTALEMIKKGTSKKDCSDREGETGRKEKLS